MVFRFLEANLQPNNEYDCSEENVKYLGSIHHEDYVEYIKLLYFMKEKGELNLTLVKEVYDAPSNTTQMILNNDDYTIVDIQLRVAVDDKFNLECVEVYVTQ